LGEIEKSERKKPRGGEKERGLITEKKTSHEKKKPYTEKRPEASDLGKTCWGGEGNKLGGGRETTMDRGDVKRKAGRLTRVRGYMERDAVMDGSSQTRGKHYSGE